MSESCTPGPWMRDGITVTVEKPAGEKRRPIATVYPDTSISAKASYDQMIGNARLIAAAPELLAELQAVRDACLYTDDDGTGDYIAVTSEPHISEDLFDRICAAINKAEGR